MNFEVKVTQCFFKRAKGQTKKSATFSGIYSSPKKLNHSEQQHIYFHLILSEVRGRTCESRRSHMSKALQKPHIHKPIYQKKRKKSLISARGRTENRKRRCSFTVRSLYTVACWFYIYTFLHRAGAEGLFYSRKNRK